MISWCQKYKVESAVALVLLFSSFFALRGLTTYPTFWFDEALNVEQARNLAEQGYINLQIAPGVPYAKPYHLTTGYPVIAPLALVFKVFGFNFAYARLYMVGWLLLFLFSAYLLARELFGWRAALFSLLLLATFAPVYGNGETVIAEVPAIALLFGGVFFLKRFRGRSVFLFLSGLCLGLSIALKPLYVLIAPALFLSRFWGKKELSWKQEFLLWCGVALPVLLYLWTIMPSPGSLGAEMLSFWHSRTAQGHAWANLVSNLHRVVTESSLVYTALLGMTLTIAAPWKRLFARQIDRTLVFLGIYGIFIFLFFLQSIGWNRYLLFSQAILLLILPFALEKVTKMAGAIIPLLIVMQTVRLFFFSHIFYSTAADDLSSFLNARAPSGSIYVVNSAEAAAFIPSSRLSQYFDFLDGYPHMQNRLAHLIEDHFEHLLVSVEDEKNVVPYLSQIREQYAETGTTRGLTLFTRTEASSKEQ